MSDIENDLEIRSDEEELKPISEVKKKVKREISEAQKANLAKAREKRTLNAKLKKEGKLESKPEVKAETKPEAKESFDYNSLDKFLNSNGAGSSDAMLMQMLKSIHEDVKTTNKRVDKMYAEKKAKRQMKGDTPQSINIINESKPGVKNPAEVNKSINDLIMGKKFKQ